MTFNCGVVSTHYNYICIPVPDHSKDGYMSGRNMSVIHSLHAAQSF